MATYPLVLIPKLLADFRQLSVSYQLPIVSVQESVTSMPRLIARKSHSWLCWVGLGLVVAGILQIGTLLGSLLFSCGAFLIIRWLRRKFTQVQRKTESETESERSRSVQPSQAQQRKAYLRELASVMQGKVLLPTGTSDAPVGASEKRFGAILEQYFPGRVFPQMEIPIPDWSKPHNYSTDFCIAIKEVNLWIDVEIDEPYDYKTGNPTHCWDDGRDANRNTFFLKNGWVVIRFSEEQVVHHPESCCKEIASLIKKLTGIAAFSNALEDVPQLNPSPLWSKRQAKLMAKAKVRDKYLKNLNLKVN